MYGQPLAPQQPMYEAPDPGRSRKLLWPLIALAVALVFAGSGIAYAYNKGMIFKDSGIKACEALRDGGTKFNGTAQNKDPMTEAQYKQLRQVFADSRYDDIRNHGTKLLDIVWQVSQLTDGTDADSGSGFAVLAYVGPLTTEMSGLQSACADQGIIVNLKNAGK